MSYQGFLETLPIPWLNRPQGKAFLAAHGVVLDDLVDRVKQAVKVRFPGLAPSDALGPLANERLLDRGPSETNESFATRLQKAWNVWPFVGTATGLLIALHFAGFTDAVLVQQNGLAYKITGTPDLDDPSACVLPAIALNTTPLSRPRLLLRSDGTAFVGADGGTTAGLSWWTFSTPNNPGTGKQYRLDEFNNDGFVSRFAILFPGPVPSMFQTNATQVSFVGTEDGSLANPWPTATWPVPFTDTTYHILVGGVTPSSGSGVPVYIPSASKTPTTVQVAAGASFAGTVDLVAYSNSPFGDIEASALARLRNIIKRWKPGKATCEGIYIVLSGRTLGWPKTTLAGMGTLGPSTVVRYTAT